MTQSEWDNFLGDLASFKHAKGHCYALPFFDLDNQYKDLITQLPLQIARYKRPSKKTERLRFEQLDALGVDWSASGKHWQTWIMRYERVNAIATAGGDPNVSQLTPVIGPWLSMQRLAYRRKQLAPGRIYLLELLGIHWNPSELRERDWDKRFQALKKYQQTHHHCDVPSASEKYKRLSVWIFAQRSNYNKGLLRADRKKQLDSIHFNWIARRVPSHHQDSAA